MTPQNPQPSLQDIVVRMQELIKLNLDTLKASPGKGNPDLIYPGMKLKLTAAPSPGDAAKAGQPESKGGGSAKGGGNGSSPGTGEHGQPLPPTDNGNSVTPGRSTPSDMGEGLGSNGNIAPPVRPTPSAFPEGEGVGSNGNIVPAVGPGRNNGIVFDRGGYQDQRGGPRGNPGITTTPSRWGGQGMRSVGSGLGSGKNGGIVYDRGGNADQRDRLPTRPRVGPNGLPEGYSMRGGNLYAGDRQVTWKPGQRPS